jgi:hypothetical protein
MIEVLKQALEALETEVSIDWTNNDEFNASAEKMHDAITSLQQAIAELESQEPVAWRWQRLGQEWILEGSLKQTPIDAVIVEPLYTHPPQNTEERNFCPRCGKRTADLTVIHTCTPPQNIEQDLSEQGRKKSAILGNNIEEMVNNGLPFLTALDTALKVYDHHTPRLHPPQRTWVGLTDDEHCDIWYKESLDWMEYGKAIEAKLKEKNT